jgi:hypothetical protein
MSAFLSESKDVRDKHIEQGATDVMEPTAPKPVITKPVQQEKKRKKSRALSPGSDKNTSPMRQILIGVIFLTAVVGAAVYIKYGSCLTNKLDAVVPVSVKPVLGKSSSAVMPNRSATKKAVQPVESTFYTSISKEIALADSHASALKSFNALAVAWKLPQVTAFEKPELAPDKCLESLASKNGLDDLTFYGTLDKFLALDYPAIIVIGISPTGKEIYAALVKASDNDFVLSPAPAGRHSLTRQEMESVWRGKALIFWKNRFGIPQQMKPDTKGKEAIALKMLLRNVGLPVSKSTIFDQKAFAALKSYQESQGITVTGQPDTQTLIRLYGKSTDGHRAKLK